ncbi:hypothetical protein Ait01nite_030400 [Actinoplanes italicus]|uniref:Helix-turn-helix protein n=1 Tax=Actinoplanes italicus TaxID=113567 RepID=A0A2T0KIZ9_9ACTN|nr:MarR family winged helix-turn-helix transcriptional regulator [Actinoplanes italicus]PRX23499.1 hypothetical protein CLV67_103247 [Actinoplanes italicus]GIE29995.1 hypothetical protein Ait01nite_030400 [Actinoplanes italicus]
MSYRQVAAVLDHAPASLTPAEALVLVAIAEQLRGTGDTRQIGTDDLARRARLSKSALRDAISRLARNGIRVRIPVGVDRRGFPLYALPGIAPRWTVPDFPAPVGCRCEGCRQGDDASTPPQPVQDAGAGPVGGDQSTPTQKPQVTEGGDTSPPPFVGGDQSTAGGDTSPSGVDQSPPGGDPSPPYPSRAVPVLDQGSRPTLAYVVDQTGATEDEARLILKTVAKRYRPRSLGAYVRGMRKGDLRELLGEHRDTHSPSGPGMPDQCGKCGPGRLIPLDDGRAKRCPTCHPGVARKTA